MQQLSKAHRAKPVTTEIIQYLRDHYDLKQMTVGPDGESNWFLIRKGAYFFKAHLLPERGYWRMALPVSLQPDGFKSSVHPLHRLIYAYHTGETLESTDVVDHEDPYICPFAGKDNDPTKLRKVSTRANAMNRKVRSDKAKGTYSGYSFHKGRDKYDVRIKMKGFNNDKVTQFGSFTYEADAYAKRCAVYEGLHKLILNDDNWRETKGETGENPRVDSKTGALVNYGDFAYDYAIPLDQWLRRGTSQEDLLKEALEEIKARM